MVNYSASDYLWQFQRLLPRGRIWHRGWGTLQAEALLTLMPTWARLHARASNLLADAFPCTTVELLPEWEATLGLPDECIGRLDTVQQRQAAVCAKFIARGGQSKEYFIALAAAAGYEIEIQEFSPFRAGWSRAGDPDYDEEWAHVWRITTPQTTVVTYFAAGLNSAGDPLATWGNEVLQCLIERYKPAHTTIIWTFGTTSSWDSGTSIWDEGESEPWDQEDA